VPSHGTSGRLNNKLKERQAYFPSCLSQMLLLPTDTIKQIFSMLEQIEALLKGEFIPVLSLVIDLFFPL
jgi:hypothetical protein